MLYLHYRACKSKRCVFIYNKIFTSWGGSSSCSHEASDPFNLKDKRISTKFKHKPTILQRRFLLILIGLKLVLLNYELEVRVKTLSTIKRNMQKPLLKFN